MTEAEKQATINKAIKWIVDTTNDNSHGYSIPNPTGPDYKCSTLVFFGWYKAGVLKNENANAAVWGPGTAHLKKILQRRSDFTNVKKKVNINKCNTLTKGDILLRATGSVHSAQYIGNCKLSEATENADGRQGDSSGGELITHGYYNAGWTDVYRYTPKITETKKASSTTKKSTSSSNKNTKRSEGQKKTYKPYVPQPIVRQNLNCKESDLTDLEKNYCTFKPVQGGEAQLQGVVQNVLSTVYLWVGIIAVVVIVIGGIKFMTSAGDPNKVKNAKNAITYAIIGLIVTLMAFAITNFVIGALEGRTS